jgi:hypothetical protein
MSTDVVTFTTGETTIRYREQYVSEGLNKKLAVALPWGTYRGFRLAAKGSGDRLVTVAADATYSDHVAVYQDATGRSLTVRRTGGDFDIDLSSYSSVTVYVTIYAVYSVGSTTLTTIRVFTEAEWASATEKNEVIILGKVDVPASGTIAAADIRGEGRRMAWQHKTSEAVAWTQILRNTGFEWADITSTANWAAAYWRQQTSGAGNSSMGPDDTDPHSGDKHMVLNYVSGIIDFVLAQYTQGIPLVPGQRFRIKFFKKMVQAATAGTLDVVVSYTTLTGGTITSGVLATLDTTIDSAYEEFDQIFEVPSALGIVSLIGVVIAGSNMTFSGSGDAIRIDDFQMWVEASAEDPYLIHQMQGEPMAMALHLWGLGTGFNSMGAQPMFEVVGGSNKVRLVRNDLVDSAAAAPPDLEFTGGLELGTHLTNDSAQALTPRLNILAASSGTEDYTLISRCSSSLTSGLPCRVYRKAAGTLTGAYVVTHNAYWTSSGWNREALADSIKMTLDADGGMIVESHSGGSGTPWLDNAWDNQWYVDPDGQYMYMDDLVAQWKNTTTTSNPAYSSIPFSNGQYAKNIVKCWGHIETDGAGGFDNIEGFNFTPSYNGNNLRITFGAAMSVLRSAPVAQHMLNGTPNDRFCNIVSMTTTAFDVELWDVSSAASVNLSIVPNIIITFIQIGQQNS